MKKIIKGSLVLMAGFGILTSCADLTKKAEEKLNQLNQKTEMLDSLVNKELDKVKALDTLINFESDKVKKLDSLINKTSTKLDSLSKNKIKVIENIFN
jgi:septal ring factor EnvC (AmiA/AmiB activator)